MYNSCNKARTKTTATTSTDHRQTGTSTRTDRRPGGVTHRMIRSHISLGLSIHPSIMLFVFGGYDSIRYSVSMKATSNASGSVDSRLCVSWYLKNQARWDSSYC